MDTFATKKKAIEFLNDLETVTGFVTVFDDGTARQAGTYILSQGEYDRPDLVPTRYKNGWGIARVPHFYAGTFGAPERERVDLSVVDGQLSVFTESDYEG